MFLVLLLFFSLFQTLIADQASSKNAERVLDMVEYTLPSPSIIGEREWKELQLDRLVTILDRSKTSFGRWGLVQLLHPIADKDQLSERKEIITFLINNPEKMEIFQKQLDQVKQLEKSLLAYWDVNDRLNQQVEQFYFSMFGLKELNKSSLALNASTAMEMFNSWKFILGALAFGGLSAEWNRWRYDKNKSSFDWQRGLTEGLAAPIRQHSPYLHVLKGAKPPYTYKDYINVFVGTDASPADRYKLGYEGYTDAVSQKIDPGFGKVGAFLGAVVPTILFDYQFISSVFAVGQRIVSMNSLLNQLQQRVSDVANCIETIVQLRKLIVNQGQGLTTYFDADNYDADLREIAKKLLSPRFLQKSEYFYSRGHVLTMHKEIKKSKKSLISLLHSVALLDAYCSIAQLYKESKDEPVHFSFPEFVDPQESILHYQNAWLPLLSPKIAVANDLDLGGDSPSKIVITGPNGGGKSTILKTYGVAAVLAQSWGIVPAIHAQQTLFTSIRTAFSPQEDLQRKLSSFTAEKKTMEEILSDIRQSNSESMLILIDEPYSKTVEAESAKRIYQFGKDIAGFSNVLVAIATHVKRPIQLEADTNGIFGNYQVRIEEPSSGMFKRLYKLEKGPAMWWFNDENKRTRFIDWIDVRSASA